MPTSSSIPFNKIHPFGELQYKSSGSMSDDKEDSAMISSINHGEGLTKKQFSMIRATIFMTGYFLANLTLTLHTKWLLNNTNFKFPWIISGLHIAVSGLGALLVLKLGVNGKAFKFTTLDRGLLTRMFFFSVLHSVNIAMSNVSMKHVSLSLHQVARSGTPLITLILEFMILGKIANKWLVISLLPVMLGIVLTVFGEMGGFEFTTLGLSLTIFGVFLASLKGVVTNFLMVGGFKMHPLELIAFVAPIASIQCLLTSIAVGESAIVYQQYRSAPFDGLLLMGLTANACLAFFLNWVSFSVNKETSALAMTVAGNVKQAASIGLAVIIFNTPLTVLNGIGICTTLIGGACYSAISFNLGKAKGGRYGKVQVSPSSILPTHASLQVSVSLIGIQDGGGGAFNFFKSFSIYRIETTEATCNFAVQRRSDDFSQLWKILKELYPAQIIPPLPEYSILSTLGRGNESSTVRERESLLKMCLQAVLDHFVLREDEYLRAFLTMEQFAESVPLIKNIEPPIQLKRDYFKWSISRKMAKDLQYQKIVKVLEGLKDLHEKLKLLLPLLDRIIYEKQEASSAAITAQESIQQLMLLSKSKHMFSTDSDRVSTFLKTFVDEDKETRSEILYFITFSIKYIDSSQMLLDRLDRFRSFVTGKRDQISALALKLDQIQMPQQAKPSFDLIFKTKTKHTRLLEEMAVIEVTYEKYAELVEKELDWIRAWLDQNFKSHLSVLLMSFIPLS